MLAEKIERFKHFLEKIEKQDRIAILYHPDADGACAAALFLNILSSKEYRVFVINQGAEIEIKKETVEKLKRLGKKGETYEEIILRLMRSVESSS